MDESRLYAVQLHLASTTTRTNRSTSAERPGTAAAHVSVTAASSRTSTYNPLYYNGQKINTQRATDRPEHLLPSSGHSLNHTAYHAEAGSRLKNFTMQQHRLLLSRTSGIPTVTIREPLPLKGENEGGEAYRAEWDEHSFSWETTAGYKFEKNGHSFDVLGGFSGLQFRLARFQPERQRLHGRRHPVEQHERRAGQRDLFGGHFLLEENQNVGLRASELQLEVALLPDRDGTLRRSLELRGQQQVGVLPVGRPQVEHFEREFPEGLQLDRRPVAAPERRSDG